MDSNQINKAIDLLEKSLTQENPKDWIGKALSLLKGLARHFGVPDGALFMQLWNHGLVGLGKHNDCVYFLENKSNL